MSWAKTDLIGYLQHSIGRNLDGERVPCSCGSCEMALTGLQALLNRAWSTYPLDSLTSPGCAGFRETLVDTAPAFFKLQFYGHGSPQQRCCLTEKMCMAYWTMSSTDPNDTGAQNCVNCSGVLDCVHARKRKALSEYVVSAEMGLLLEHIRFLSNIQAFVGQAQRKNVPMMQLHVINAKRSVQEFVAGK